MSQPSPALSSPMKVCIVSYEESSWILGKFARQLAERAPAFGVQAAIGKQPDPQADINHHIIYDGYDGRAHGIDSLMITHIDTMSKAEMLRRALATAAIGVCMSRDMVEQLAAHGIPREKLCFISPAHDGIWRPRRIRVGITSNVYPSGCKRESLVADLAERIEPADFTFVIMGRGWEGVIARLRARGIEVEDLGAFHYETYVRTMPGLDYYLYTGLDEGSMGFIDAVAAGVRTIVTPQGFHLDAPDGVTHAFTDLDELARIFNDISDERRRRVVSVASWTWEEYARRHVALWEYLLAQRQGRAPSEGALATLPEIGIGGAAAPRPAEGSRKAGPSALPGTRPVVVIDDMPRSWITRLARFIERKYFIGRDKLRHAMGWRWER